MIKLKEFIQRAKAFIDANPQRKKLLLIIFVLVAIPLTVIAALTVQDLRQRAGGGSGIQILDASGNFISITSDTNVRLRVTLPENWVSLGMNKNNLIKQAYAQTSPPTCRQILDQDTCKKNGCLWTYDITDSGFCTTKSSAPTPTNTPAPTPPPIIVGNCGNKNCSSNQTCIGTSFDSSTFCITKGVGGLGSYCGTPNKTPNSEVCSSGYCDSTLRCANQSQEATPIPVNPTATPAVLPTSGISPTSGPTPTPIPQLINALRIENKDTDGSYGGSTPINITSNFNSYISPALISWKLNDLLPEQNQATRIVQVTLFSNTGAIITLGASITLVRAPVSYTVSPISYTVSPMPSKTPPVTWTVGSTFDLNGDGAINCKDIEILVGQYGKRGTGFSADLNKDEIVDGIDYNTIVRNYTPGDTTVCK